MITAAVRQRQRGQGGDAQQQQRRQQDVRLGDAVEARPIDKSRRQGFQDHRRTGEDQNDPCADHQRYEDTLHA
jgi:hypothetical protein